MSSHERAKLPADFLKMLSAVTAKRPKTVIDHILKHGQITSQELKDIYGYNHPPRAIRDVREQGIPIETFRVRGNDGRSIAAYRFGDPTDVRKTDLLGRTAFGIDLKAKLIERYGQRCNIYQTPLPERELQIDHRIPYEIAGETLSHSDDLESYMLLSRSANRVKSWSCEHCPNWDKRDIEICRTCYWAYPESYSHVGMRQSRRIDIEWSENEVGIYDRISDLAMSVGESIPDYIKDLLKNHAESHDEAP